MDYYLPIVIERTELEVSFCNETFPWAFMVS
jgi:hypothetical protein